MHDWHSKARDKCKAESEKRDQAEEGGGEKGKGMPAVTL